MEKTKIAIIGLGGIAQLVHIPNFAKISNAEITDVAEIRKTRLNTIADKFNIKNRYSNYNELLEKTEADAVIISTPTGTHKDVAAACIKSNKDILIEKPFARTYDEGKSIVDAAKKSKTKIMVGMNLRFRPDAMILKSLLNAGEIGSPFYIKCGWIRRPSSNEKWFTVKEESGGGVIIDLGILLLDLSLWLLDYPPVLSVSTQCYSHNTKNVEDTAISFLKCKNESLILLETSWSLLVEKDYFFVNVYGKGGTASLNPLKVYKKIGDQIMDLSPSQKDSALTLFKKSYLNELKSFIGAVKGLNPVFSSGDEALSRLKVMEAMYKSSSTHSEIKI